jgi:hypothetical protein
VVAPINRGAATTTPNQLSSADASANAAYIQQLLDQALGLDPADANQLAQAIGKGGAAGMAIAMSVATMIANRPQRQGTGASPNTAIDSAITSLPWRHDSTEVLTTFLRAKLIALKARYQPR